MWRKIQRIIFKPSDLRFVKFLFLSLVINYPVDVEVLDRTHGSFNVKQIHRFFASWVAPDQLPDLSKENLLFLELLRLDEAEVQEQLAHLGAGDLGLDLVVLQAERGAWRLVVLAETRVQHFVGLRVDKRPVGVDLGLLALDLVDLRLVELSALSVF